MSTYLPHRESDLYYKKQKVVQELVKDNQVTSKPIPNLDSFKDATPILVKSDKGMLGKPLVIFIVVIVICIVLFAALFAGIPSTPTPPVSFPSQPQGEDNGNVIKPGVIQKEFIEYAAISDQDTVHLYDKDMNELVIDLDDKNWSDIQFSPDGRFVSVLSASDEDQQDNNLVIYSIDEETWTDITVYSKETGGITQYVWISNEEIIFFQDGWMHKYSLQSSEIVKVADLNSELFIHDNQNQRLIVREKQTQLIKEAVIEQQPDPDFIPQNRAPLIDVEISPEIVKVDNTFRVVDYNGQTIAGYKLSDFVEITGSYILNGLYPTGAPDQYLAELIWYNPQNGEVSLTAAGLYKILNTEVTVVPTIANNSLYKIVGRLTGQTFLVSILSSDRTVERLSSFDFTSGMISNPEVQAENVYGEKYLGIEWKGYPEREDRILSIETENEVRGINQIYKTWYYINVDQGLLEEITFAEGFPELVYFQRSE